MMILFTTLNNYSQDIPAVSKGKLKFYFDSDSFIGKADSTYQEFYLMFHSDQLKEIRANTNGPAIINLEAKIFSPTRVEISKRSWVTEIDLRSDSTELEVMVTFDQWGEYLTPGSYNISIVVSDPKGVSAGTLESDFDVKQIDENSFSLSDVQLVFKTEDETENKLFRKAGKNVFPNVWRRYGVLNPKLTFYYEVYGIDTTVSEPLLVDYTIINEAKAIAKKISAIELKREGKQRSVLQALDISNLSSSLYNLEIIVTDPKSNLRTSQNKKFEVIQFDRYSSSQSLSEEDIELFDELFSYIADDIEYNQYKKLNDSEKGNFILNYWKSKDPNPSTPENEYLLKVIEKFNYANKNYSWSDQPGWKSDRGRVLIKYGMPTNIESHQSEPNTVPYEIWTYQLEKNYSFVFADRRTTGKYTLIHSDMIGEVSDPSWINLIRK
jgi:GWxTD domain-containing protein